MKTPAQRLREKYAWLLDGKQQALPAIVEEYLGVSVELRKQSLRSWLSHCESPIEQLLGIELFNLWFDPGSLVGHVRIQYEMELEGRKLRLDFAVFSTVTEQSPTLVQVAVECDGHNFHERTKEQAKRDKERDRLLQRSGWTVMRFTGSEIYRDPARCASEVENTISALSGYDAWIQDQIRDMRLGDSQ